MKLLTIEQVDNGYIVSNKPDESDINFGTVRQTDGIHVFETFASMSKWLEGHFGAGYGDLTVGIPAPLGNNDDL